MAPLKDDTQKLRSVPTFLRIFRLMKTELKLLLFLPRAPQSPYRAPVTVRQEEQKRNEI